MTKTASRSGRGWAANRRRVRGSGREPGVSEKAHVAGSAGREGGEIRGLGPWGPMHASDSEGAAPPAGEAPRPNPEAIAWYVEEAQRLLEDQQRRAESLRTRGGQIAGFGAAVLAVDRGLGSLAAEGFCGHLGRGDRQLHDFGIPPRGRPLARSHEIPAHAPESGLQLPAGRGRRGISDRMVTPCVSRWVVILVARSCYPRSRVNLMSEIRRSSPTQSAHVPLDQTEGPIYYDGGAVRRDLGRLWSKVRQFFAGRRRDC